MFIVQKDPKSIGAEAYKTLRTNVQYSSFDKNTQIIVVTSSQPGEGKSTTSGNLAISMAQDGKKTILIDCDLRKPTVHKKFGISNKIGLSEVIIGKADINVAIQEFSNNLAIITSGKIPPNPSEMLGSENMKRLLEELREFYDYIILDTAPILAVTDSQILSRSSDGTILVVKAGHTKKDMVLKAKKQLDKVGGKVLGTVLNAVDSKNGRNNYYYYYGNEK